MNSRFSLFATPARAVAVLVLFFGVVFGLAAGARCEVPELTAENGPRLIDKTATLQMDVVSLRFADRRKTHFLNSSVNFRGRSNLPVAIRDDDLKHFRSAGIDDLEAHYKNRRIRARGKVLRDEGQILLLVSRPDQIEVLDTAPAKPSDSERVLVVVNEQGKSIKFELPLPDSLPRQRLRVDHEGTEETYTGVTLAAVLERAGVALGRNARQLARYVLVSARDDFGVVFSVAEVDPFLSNQTILLIESFDGHPIAAKDAPSLAVSGDKHHRRWIRQVSRIEVRRAVAGADGEEKASRETPDEAPAAR